MRITASPFTPSRFSQSYTEAHKNVAVGPERATHPTGQTRRPTEALALQNPLCPSPSPKAPTHLSSSPSWATPIPNMDRARLKRAAPKGSEVLRPGLASRKSSGRAGEDGRDRDSLGKTWQKKMGLILALSRPLPVGP